MGVGWLFWLYISIFFSFLFMCWAADWIEEAGGDDTPSADRSCLKTVRSTPSTTTISIAAESAWISSSSRGEESPLNAHNVALEMKTKEEEEKKTWKKWEKWNPPHAFLYCKSASTPVSSRGALGEVYWHLVRNQKKKINKRWIVEPSLLAKHSASAGDYPLLSCPLETRGRASIPSISCSSQGLFTHRV